MFAKLNNYKKTVRDGIDTDKMEFKPLKDLCGQHIKVDGFFFTTGKYGKQVVVVGNGVLINMPERCVAQFEDIAADEEMLKAVLEGHLMLDNIAMKTTKNGTTTIFDYADC